MRWREVPVLLHGITPGEAPASHGAQYAGLLEGLEEAFERAGKAGFDGAPVPLEWGWEDGGRNSWPDAALASVERVVRRGVDACEDPVLDPTLNPSRLLSATLRRAFIHGFADLFYYVSPDGEAALRAHLFGALSNGVGAPEAEEGISLTLFAHSAGAVIAHDFLYHLAGRPEPHPAAAPLRHLRVSGRLRVRRLYTFGAPLAPLMCRSAALIARLNAGRTLDPADLSLSPEPGLEGPRWLNFWDRDDLVAYPVAWAYAAPGGRPAVEDRYADLGDSFPSVHGRYWFDRGVARAIAGNW